MKKTLLFSVLLSLTSLNTRAEQDAHNKVKQDAETSGVRTSYIVYQSCKDKTHDAFIAKKDANFLESVADFITPQIITTGCEYIYLKCEEKKLDAFVTEKDSTFWEVVADHLTPELRSQSCTVIKTRKALPEKNKPLNLKISSPEMKLRYCLSKLEKNMINIFKPEKKCNPLKDKGVMYIIPPRQHGNDNISLKEIAKDTCLEVDQRLNACETLLKRKQTKERLKDVILSDDKREKLEFPIHTVCFPQGSNSSSEK